MNDMETLPRGRDGMVGTSTAGGRGTNHECDQRMVNGDNH